MCHWLPSWPLIKVIMAMKFLKNFLHSYSMNYLRKLLKPAQLQKFTMSCGISERAPPENRSGTTGCRLRSSNATVSSTSSNNTVKDADKTTNFGKKPCCLCWCCCCSCTCCDHLKCREDDKIEYVTTPPNNNPSPDLEEVMRWAQSFESVLKSEDGMKVFRDFLRMEYSEENILFWLSCEELKSETEQDIIEEKARVIYEDYISILSPKEVSLDARVREIVNRNMVEPTPHTFDEAQLQIYTLMHRDSYPRFLTSSVYKELLNIKIQEAAELEEERERQRQRQKRFC